MQKHSLLVIVILFAICSSCAQSLTGESDSEAEEYSVYSALISSEYAYRPGALIISDETLPVSKWEWLSESISMLKGPISQETIADFRTKNKYAYQLGNQFNLPMEYVLVDVRIDQSEFFEEDFLDTYDASGIVVLSRVGFGRKVDQALIYVIYFCGGECGEDGYFLLEKEDRIWKVQEKLLLGGS